MRLHSCTFKPGLDYRVRREIWRFLVKANRVAGTRSMGGKDGFTCLYAKKRKF
jgi:hypothetical protein